MKRSIKLEETGKLGCRRIVFSNQHEFDWQTLSAGLFGFCLLFVKLIEMEQNCIVSIWAWKSHLWVVGTNRLEDYYKLPLFVGFVLYKFKKHNSQNQRERHKKYNSFVIKLRFNRKKAENCAFSKKKKKSYSHPLQHVNFCLANDLKEHKESAELQTQNVSTSNRTYFKWVTSQNKL